MDRIGNIEISQAPCANCGGKTNHGVVARRVLEKSYDEPDAEIDEWSKESYETIECLGCGQISFRHLSEWQFESGGGLDVHYYPPRTARRKPAWRDQLPEIFTPVFDEIYVALQVEARTLALMGVRAVLDLLFVDKVGDIGGFDEKLKNLLKHEWISEADKDYVGAVVDAGSAAAHRAYVPSEGELSKVIDILENVLQSVYVLDAAARMIKSRVPPRPPKPKKDKPPD